MEFKNGTEALSKALAQSRPEFEQVESMHRAEVDAAHLPTLLRDPKLAVKALGLPVSDESQVQVTVKGRSHRDPNVSSQARLIIVIVIKYRNCDADIIIIVL
jgi:hypothetical protein